MLTRVVLTVSIRTIIIEVSCSLKIIYVTVTATFVMRLLQSTQWRIPQSVGRVYAELKRSVFKRHLNVVDDRMSFCSVGNRFYPACTRSVVQWVTNATREERKLHGLTLQVEHESRCRIKDCLYRLLINRLMALGSNLVHATDFYAECCSRCR